MPPDGGAVGRGTPVTEALCAVGAEVQLHLHDDADHMWLGSTAAAADALARTTAFLGARLDTAPD